MEISIDPKGFNALVKGKHGLVIYNKNDIYVGKAIQTYGEFSELETDLFKHYCHSGDVVVEVGSNIGAHTLSLSKMVGENGRVYAYEPQRIVFQTLCANMAINSIKNVECYQIAISSKDGSAFIPNIDYTVRGNFGGIEADKAKTGEKVVMSRLQDILEVPRLNFLKIDVEGMEFSVIKGAKKLIEKHQPVIYLENDRPNKSESLIKTIWSMGYKAYWHLPPLFNPNNFAGNTENIFSKIVSVNMLCIPKSKEMTYPSLKEIVDANDHPMKNHQ